MKSEANRIDLFINFNRLVSIALITPSLNKLTQPKNQVILYVHRSELYSTVRNCLTLVSHLYPTDCLILQ